jgi:hypothetical protein
VTRRGTRPLADDPFPLARVRLTRKYADRLDGIDLSWFAVGDVLELPLWQGQLLIAEHWAEPVTGPPDAPESKTTTAPRQQKRRDLAGT